MPNASAATGSQNCGSVKIAFNTVRIVTQPPGPLVPAAAQRYTPAMREFTVPALVLLSCLAAPAQTPSGWKVVKDAKSLCQISVPPDWTPLGENNGAAVFKDASTAIAVVTAQPGQEFKPLTPGFLRSIALPKEKLFENTAKRIFYQDQTSKGPDDTSAFSVSVPAKNGSCSGHVAFLPSVPEDTARKIALRLAPVPET
jgi:hypothetical protein